MTPQHPPGGPLSIWAPVHLGTDELGQRVNVTLAERNMLIGGEPGGGKSVALQLIVAHGALSPDCRLVLVDGKRVELGLWHHSAEHFIGPSIDDAIGTFQWLQTMIDERTNGCSITASGRSPRTWGSRSTWSPSMRSPTTPPPPGPPPHQKKFSALNRDIVARGRAPGIIAIEATQRPSADIIPTRLRDLFGYRWAFRCSTEASSDTILGHGWASKGYTADRHRPPSQRRVLAARRRRHPPPRQSRLPLRHPHHRPSRPRRRPAHPPRRSHPPAVAPSSRSAVMPHDPHRRLEAGCTHPETSTCPPHGAHRGTSPPGSTCTADASASAYHAITNQKLKIGYRTRYSGNCLVRRTRPVRPTFRRWAVPAAGHLPGLPAHHHPPAHHHHRRHAMTAPGLQDHCPACGDNEVQPFAVIIGAAETYGYQCLICSVTWIVMQTPTPPDAYALRGVMGKAR